jgi:hypothetical protein
MDNLNELREDLRNSQLESLKGLATTLLEAPLENDYNLILISGTKGDVQVEAKLGGSSINIIPLLDSLLETTHKILSEVPKEYLEKSFEQNKLLLLKLLALNGVIFEELSEFVNRGDDE